MNNMNYDSRQFYDRIKQLVKHNGLTIETLCIQSNYNVHTYKNARARGILPSFDVIINMSTCLGVSLDYLAYGHNHVIVSSDEDKAILEKITKLGFQSKATLQNVLNALILGETNDHSKANHA